MPDIPRDIHSLSHEEHEKLARLVMRRQAALSLRVAAVFAVLILGLPLVNTWFPEAANQIVFGFPATWLFLGVLFFPITWLLSAYFIRASDRIEASCSDWRHELGLEAEGVGEIHPAFVEGGEEDAE
jgi:uncharacterized membrane protein (DUF485 family)